MTTAELRAMDAEIARLLFGRTVVSAERGRIYRERTTRAGDLSRRPVPHYSTSLNSAWTVLERLSEDGCTVKLWMCNNPKRWLCSIMHGGVGWLQAGGETAPIAICRAAINAVSQRCKRT